MKKLGGFFLSLVMLCGLMTGTVIAKEAGDVNIAYEAEVSVTDEAGLAVPAGRGGVDWWRANTKGINDYYIHSDPHYWGYNYTISPEILPVNVDFDYGAEPAEIGQITLMESCRNTDTPNIGTYTKVRLEYFDGTQWAAITPPGGSDSYTVNGDGSVSLNWSAPSWTEPLLNEKTLMMIDIELSSRVVSDRFRLKILEAVGNGDCYGEFGIDEVLMYGRTADAAAVGRLGAEFQAALAEKEVAKVQKLATAEQIAAARALTGQVADAEKRSELQASLDAYQGKEWTNLALDAEVTAGVSGESAAMLNDDNTIGTPDLSWGVPVGTATAQKDHLWFQFDYGQEVTIRRIELGSRYLNCGIKEFELYSILGGNETKVGAYHVQFGKVPENAEFNLNSAFTTEAFAYIKASHPERILNDTINYTDMRAIQLENPVVCNGLRIKVLDWNVPESMDLLCPEARTYGFTGEDTKPDYTESNLAFSMPVSLYDADGNALAMSGLGGGQRMSPEYLTDYAMDTWYSPYWPHEKLPFYLEVDYQGKVTELDRAVLGLREWEAGLIEKLEMQMYDGTEWKAVLPSVNQTEGITAEGGQVSLDWSIPSDQEGDGSKTYRFMNIKFDQPVLGYKFRILVKEASDDGGAVHLDELLTWGWNPTWSDLNNRGNAEEIQQKHRDLTLRRALDEPTEQNVAAAREEIAKLTDEDSRALYTSVLDRLGVWDRLEASGAAGMGSNAGGLTDGRFGEADTRWDSGTTEFTANSWVQIDFTAPAQVKKIRLASRYYPASLKKIDILAKVGGELIPLAEDVRVDFSAPPELAWYSNAMRFDVQAKQAYVEHDLMWQNNLEIAKPSWVEVALPRTVACNGIRVQIKEAEIPWGSYAVAELEAVGRPETAAIFAANQRLCLTDHSPAESLDQLKTSGGYFSADLGNPYDTAQEAVMLALYYRGGKLIDTDIKAAPLAAHSAAKAQQLKLEFDERNENCDTVKCYIWSGLNDTATAKGTGSWLELS